MKSNLYPKLSAQIFENQQAGDGFFLFNTDTNKGFSIDSLAALLCKKFTGEHTLEKIIADFKVEEKLEENEFIEEIDALIEDLEINKLITFFDTPQLSTKDT